MEDAGTPTLSRPSTSCTQIFASVGLTMRFPFASSRDSGSNVSVLTKLTFVTGSIRSRSQHWPRMEPMQMVFRLGESVDAE